MDETGDSNLPGPRLRARLLLYPMKGGNQKTAAGIEGASRAIPSWHRSSGRSELGGQEGSHELPLGEKVVAMYVGVGTARLRPACREQIDRTGNCRVGGADPDSPPPGRNELRVWRCRARSQLLGFLCVRVRRMQLMRLMLQSAPHGHGGHKRLRLVLPEPRSSGAPSLSSGMRGRSMWRKSAVAGSVLDEPAQ